MTTLKSLVLLIAIAAPIACSAIGTEQQSGITALPTTWKLSPAGSDVCSIGGGGGRSSNSYAETSSKFLTWVTGNVEMAEYEPIGEVANYFGFAALRTEIRQRRGAQGDTGFRGSIYREILELLNDSQRAVLYDLLEQHKPLVRGFLDERVELIHELWSLKSGKTMDFERVSELMVSIGEHEGAIAVTAAQAYAKLLPMLTDDQLQYMKDIRHGIIGADEMRASSLRYASEANTQFNALDEFEQELMQEVSSKVIAWVTGDTEQALFLPPGKIGNYFGFSSYRYVDRAGVSRSGAASIVHETLTAEQRDMMCKLSWNVATFTDAYINGRATLISGIFDLKNDPAANVDSLAKNYAQSAGVGEGRRAAVEAIVFSQIESTLNNEQREQLIRLRSGTDANESPRRGGGRQNGGGSRRSASQQSDAEPL